MSSSDDYHRHRLRTTTKYFKVSVKPFQRLGGVRGGSPGKGLAECEAEPHENSLGGVRGGSPGRGLAAAPGKSTMQITGGEVFIQFIEIEFTQG